MSVWPVIPANLVDDLKIRLGYKETVTLTRDELLLLLDSASTEYVTRPVTKPVDDE
jgi:hypothetical protein